MTHTVIGSYLWLSISPIYHLKWAWSSKWWKQIIINLFAPQNIEGTLCKPVWGIFHYFHSIILLIFIYISTSAHLIRLITSSSIQYLYANFKNVSTFLWGISELCNTEYTISPQFSWPDSLAQSTNFVCCCVYGYKNIVIYRNF